MQALQIERKKIYKLNAEKIIKTKGQYLTHLLSQQFSKNLKYFAPIIKKTENNEIQDLKKKKINTQSVISCIIQSAYLLYVSFWYRIGIEVSQVCIDMRQLKINQPINMYIIYKIDNTDQKIKLIPMLNNLIQQILVCYQKFQNSNDIYLRNFQNQYNRFKIQLKNLVKQKDYMLCLEQTQLFRRHSLLTKIKNSSILNIIKSDQNKLKALMEKKNKQKELIQNFNIFKKQKNTLKINEIELELQKNIKQYFQNVLKSNTRFTPIEITKDDPYKLKFYIRFHQKNIPIKQNEKLQKQHRQSKQKQITFQKQVYSIIKKYIQPDSNNLKPIIPISTFQYIVQYSSQRNSICVKLITDIQLSVQTSDFLMFQCNNLSFDSSNINLQLIQKSMLIANNLQKMRYIAFKGTSCFTQKQPPIQKILLLIDITMIAYKGLEQQLTKSIINSRDYLKSYQLHKKINHYIAIINFVSKKVYATNEQTKSHELYRFQGQNVIN